jgi:hypothetical protein
VESYELDLNQFCQIEENKSVGIVLKDGETVLGVAYYDEKHKTWRLTAAKELSAIH